MLLLGASATTFLGGAFHPGGSWVTTPFGSGSATTPFATTPTLTADASGDGVGVVVPTNSSLEYTIWHNATWSTPAPIVDTVTVRSPPCVDASNGATAHLVYQDANYKYWHVGYNGSWATPDAIGPSGSQDFGPFTATIAALGANASVAFFDGIGGDGGDVNYAATADSISGVWQPTVDLEGNTIAAITNQPYTVPPVIVALGSGTDVLLAYVDSGTAIHSVRRTGGTWGPATTIPTTLTTNYIAMAALPNEGAILAYRGTNGMLYWSLYTGGSWSTVMPFASPNITVDGTPAVSHGVGGDVAELAYVASGVAYHARLSTSNTWSAPVTVGGTSLVGVALASTP